MSVQYRSIQRRNYSKPNYTTCEGREDEGESGVYVWLWTQL